MNSYLLDTSALLRFVLHDIPEQSDEVALFLEKAENHLCTVTIPTLTFFEATFVLTSVYKFARCDVARELRQFLQFPSITIPDRDIVQRGYDTWVEKTGVSFADCIILHMALSGEKELITFDLKLKKAFARLK
jgi:predicted nucleic acid-binding protein